MSDEKVVGSELDDVVNIAVNTNVEDYNLSLSLSTNIYSEYAVELWPIHKNRGLIEERLIDSDAYEKYNLVTFLEKMRILSTVTAV